MNKYPCYACNKVFSVKYNWTKHKMVHDITNAVMCVVCNKTFAHKYALSAHILYHSTEKFKCEICFKELKCKKYFRAHMYNHNPDAIPKEVASRIVKCDICGLICTYRSHLENHKESHNENPIYKCHLCSKAFKQKHNLKKHHKNIHDPQPFPFY